MTDPACTSLSEEIARFYSDRRRVQNLLAETEALLDKDFARVLSHELVSRIQHNLNLPRVRQRIDRLFRDGRRQQDDDATVTSATGSRPCIVIVGQTKSGKSTFVNELLGQKFVSQRSTPCTARVTRLTYAEKVSVRLVDSHGRQLGETVYPENGQVSEDFTSLRDADREDEALLSASVEAGVPSEFLRLTGLDIVDSPGLNENDALDSLTMRAVDSFLPIILYVIDGQYGVNLAAEKDIQSIRATAPGLELFYLVTKMDVSKEDAKESGRTVEDIEEERTRRAFDRLRSLQCVGELETPSNCGRFFCLSSWEMMSYRRRVRAAIRKARGETAAGASVPRNKWVLRFDEMQRRLAEFAASQFRSLIVSACASLKSLHCGIVEVMMSKANDIRASALKRRENLGAIRQIECRNHSQSKEVVDRYRQRFLEQADSFVKQQASVILEAVKTMEYSDSVIGASLSSSQIENRCIEEIHRFINNRIMSAYQDFLRLCGMRDCFAELEDLRSRVFEYEREIDQTPSFSVLKASLVDHCELSQQEIYSSGLQAMMRDMSLKFRTLLRHPGMIFSRPVQDPEWKRFQANCHLKRIETDKLVECLFKAVHSWLDERHFKFIQKIRCSEQLVENAASLSELERQRIVQLSPKLAFMYTRCLDIVTAYQLRGYIVDNQAQLGAGAQGVVCLVKDAQGRVAMAAKVVRVEMENLGNISSEVFYSSVLRHPNLVAVEGVRLFEHRDEVEDDVYWTIELYMELMHCDVWNLMQRQQLPLRKRLWFGLKLARALEFLHSSCLIHRDVKLQNLLVNSDLQMVKLTDFGLTKSAGLTGQSLVGTPIYLAPEMVTKSCYDTSADVYSLGIALWYLAEGTGRKHPDYVEVMPSVGAILLASSMNSRPNRLECIPSDLWDLMERCWHADPHSRPPAREVADALEYIESCL